MQPLLSTSLTGWGIGNLDQDADELGQLVQHLKSDFDSEVRALCGALQAAMVQHSHVVLLESSCCHAGSRSCRTQHRVPGCGAVHQQAGRAARRRHPAGSGMVLRLLCFTHLVLVVLVMLTEQHTGSPRGLRPTSLRLSRSLEACRCAAAGERPGLAGDAARDRWAPGAMRAHGRGRARG